MNTIKLFLILLISFPTAALAATVIVGNEAELRNAVAAANSSGGNTHIVIKDGTYNLTDTLYINAPNVTVSGQSGDRQKVILQGDAMSAQAKVKMIFRVNAPNFTVRDITMQRVGWHIIQVIGNNNADYATVSNCVLRDSYQQLLKVTFNDATPNVTGDNGLVEDCLFEYSAGIGPQYYIGGVDAHASGNWTVRRNVFKNIISPANTVAEHAIHFWNTSKNNLVEQNLIVNCDRGIGFGLGSRGNTGGIVRNNMIYHAANRGAFADVAIGLENSPGTQVYNNTVFLENSYPNAIEYRYAATSNVLIVNNLTNKGIQARDGAKGTVSNNLTSALSSYFVNPAAGDLHLSSPIASVSGAGQQISGLTDDFDGEPRPLKPDIGADQYSVVLASPRNLRILR